MRILLCVLLVSCTHLFSVELDKYAIKNYIYKWKDFPKEDLKYQLAMLFRLFSITNDDRMSRIKK